MEFVCDSVMPTIHLGSRDHASIFVAYTGLRGFIIALVGVVTFGEDTSGIQRKRKRKRKDQGKTEDYFAMFAKRRSGGGHKKMAGAQEDRKETRDKF